MLAYLYGVITAGAVNQKFAAVRRNVEEFLSPPRQTPARQRDMDLE